MKKKNVYTIIYGLGGNPLTKPQEEAVVKTIKSMGYLSEKDIRRELADKNGEGQFVVAKTASKSAAIAYYRAIKKVNSYAPVILHGDNSMLNVEHNTYPLLLLEKGSSPVKVAKAITNHTTMTLGEVATLIRENPNVMLYFHSFKKWKDAYNDFKKLGCKPIMKWNGCAQKNIR